jgi:cell division protein FtsI (penicillin-binding protein 3)
MSPQRIAIDRKIKRNYFIVTIALIGIALAIIGRAFFIWSAEGGAWRKKGDEQRRPNIEVPATRGNIYSADRQLMATTESRFRLYIDFWADGIDPDTLKKYVGPLSIELHKAFPQKSAEQYKSRIMDGWKMCEKEQASLKAGKKTVKKSREYKLLDNDINYLEWLQIQKMPYFSKGKFKSGLYYKELVIRTKPYGTLASRTIGDIYHEFGKGGKNGLELQYDSLLRGEPGTSTRQKVNGRVIDVIDEKPIQGKDIVSTIDITIQDITEKTLRKKLAELNAESGTAVVMETATGEIKAITNMGRVRDGVWGEDKNYAVSDLSEPGSTFKVVSMMVALEDGLVHSEDSIDVGNGVVTIAGQTLRDHNAHRGGYGRITAAKSIRYSSNIGVAKLIMRAYGSNPSKYVDAIYKLGLNQDMHLEIPGYAVPYIQHPKDKNRYWDATALPWMSFGYRTQIPPIYTLAFFNAIANNGKMMKPMFVKEILDQGEVVEKKKPQVINPAICSESTLAAIRQMLDDVVNQPDGTGKPARSNYVRIAGKTGTAQLSKGAAGYKGAGLSHQVSFCGYFPADKPLYTCIVVIRNPGEGAASGGFMCGSVLKEIAEEMYAKNIFRFVPPLPVDTIRPLEAKAKHSIDNPKAFTVESVPNVVGMGAKDAIFSLEKAGLRVNLTGKGTVVRQSVAAGSRISKGQTVIIELK